jgi:GT2 family glycosyltransferase
MGTSLPQGQHSNSGSMKIVVAIATSGRREILSTTIRQLAKQERLPDCVYVCPASADDLDPSCLQEFPGMTEIVSGPRGSSHQRNAIVNRAVDADLVVFFDDDFLAEPQYLAEAEKLFQRMPDLVIASGKELADGAMGPGLSVEHGLAILADAPPVDPAAGVVPSYAGYGCNMIVRIAVARAQGIAFDERLPLYGWWEDVDYCRCLEPYGQICRSGRLRGVHLGSKTGKTPGKRLGYSQVANLIYMTSKGSVGRRMAYKKIAFNVAANFARSFAPEPWIDRRGRLAGNLTAFAHLIIGTISPEKAKDL